MACCRNRDVLLVWMLGSVLCLTFLMQTERSVSAETITSITDTYHGCSSFSQRCSSGECISEEYVCDGKDDCRDGSDEADCRYILCNSPFLFKCDYGACISKNKMCDGSKDCKDNSDEANCNNRYQYIITTERPVDGECGSNSIKCNSGNCIEEHQLCDGKEDCEDGSDENNRCRGVPCNSRFKFRCAYGACIRKNLRCNGKSDCKDNSDELNCETHHTFSVSTQKPNTPMSSPCGNNYMKCHSGECLPEERFCDGTEDCQDGSDEDECQTPCAASPYLFRCAYGACISKSLVCNGKTDCKDNSDEISCDSYHSIQKPYIPTDPTCGNYYKRCQSGDCLLEEKFCDGTEDCQDGSDENECQTPCAASPYLFRCAYGACISKSLVCNGKKDCKDNSDETNCHRNHYRKSISM